MTASKPGLMSPAAASAALDDAMFERVRACVDLEGLAELELELVCDHIAVGADAATAVQRARAMVHDALAALARTFLRPLPAPMFELAGDEDGDCALCKAFGLADDCS